MDKKFTLFFRVLLLSIVCMLKAYAAITPNTLEKLFQKKDMPLSGEPVVTSAQDLVIIAQETADFLKKIDTHKSKYISVGPGLLEYLGVTLQDVQETAEYLAHIGKTKPKLLQSSWFLNKNFEFYRWYGDESKDKAPKCKGWKQAPEHIHTTQYRIIEILGSKTKTKKYIYPLYRLPDDEKNLTRKEIKEKEATLTRFQYSRGKILNGALKKNKLTEPLAWVTDAGRRELVMQGTALICFDIHGADNRVSNRKSDKKLVQVAGSNGMKHTDQYWFVTEKTYKNAGKTKFPVKVEPRADVSYAGDINLLGFGKMIALVCWNPIKKRDEVRLGFLVDTGSAFKNNLSKLDMFTGYFPNETMFKKQIQSYPHTARAYILIKKKTKH